jgi:hypothetical protein
VNANSKCDSVFWAILQANRPRHRKTPGLLSGVSKNVGGSLLHLKFALTIVKLSRHVLQGFHPKTTNVMNVAINEARSLVSFQRRERDLICGVGFWSTAPNAQCETELDEVSKSRLMPLDVRSAAIRHQATLKSQDQQATGLNQLSAPSTCGPYRLVGVSSMTARSRFGSGKVRSSRSNNWLATDLVLRPSAARK